jgi:hypothetical protein
MLDMWTGYMWGENTNYTVSWDQPRLIVADSSIWMFDSTGLPRVTAWIRSVTVKDPSTGAITVKPSGAAVPVRIENNAIAVTFALNSVNCFDAEALIHVYYWS